MYIPNLVLSPWPSSYLSLGVDGVAQNERVMLRVHKGRFLISTFTLALKKSAERTGYACTFADLVELSLMVFLLHT